MGILKHRFQILQRATGYSNEDTAALFNSLCCMHNIIKYNAVPITRHGPDLSEEIRKEQPEFEQRSIVALSTGEINLNKKGEELRDQIAHEMWQDHQRIMRSRHFRRIEEI